MRIQEDVAGIASKVSALVVVLDGMGYVGVPEAACECGRRIPALDQDRNDGGLRSQPATSG
jgi:uncharacterized protein YjeT (DUF2065 family)